MNEEPAGKLTRRDIHGPRDVNKRKDLDTNKALFADAAVFLFLSRDAAIAGAQHVVDGFNKFGLTVHLGTRGKDGKEVKSKMKPCTLPTKR